MLRHPDLILVLLAALVLSIAWPTISLTHRVATSLLPMLAAVQTVPVLLLRRSPPLAWALALAGCGLWWALVPALPSAPMPWPVMQFLVLLLTLVVLPLAGDARLLVGAGALTGLALYLFMPQQLRAWAWACLLFIGVGVLLRSLIISRWQLARQTERVEQEQAARAVEQERARIARELHDVVAHHMSMIVVQASSAPVRLGVQDARVAAEFAGIEQSARQALGEVRGVLGVLREGQAPAQRAPQPTAADLAALVDSTRSSGVPVTAELDLTPDAVPAGTGLVLYRIVQESLANAARHAPGRPVSVRVLEQDDALHLRVHNPRGAAPDRSRPDPAPIPGGGSGIPGMVARAEAVGGHLSAADDAAGFTVTAELPLAGRPDVSGLG